MRPLSLAAAAAALALASSAGAAPRPSGAVRSKRPRLTHPAITDPSTDCATCHATATPEAFLAWKQSKHGLALVKCFVCHGSTGPDFVRRPPPARCEGCHAEQVASLGAGGPASRARDCFSCHTAHALSPHVTRAEHTAAARVRADAELERDKREEPAGPPAPPPGKP